MNLSRRDQFAMSAMQGLLSGYYSDGTKGNLSEVPIEAAMIADALIAELDKKAVPAPDADGWIAHVPGDARPCDGDLAVDIITDCGVPTLNNPAIFWGSGTSDWWVDGPITAWRPAR